MDSRRTSVLAEPSPRLGTPSWLRAIRRAILTLLVTVLVVWPPIHMVLVRQLGFSSWKFAGWGMYATPFSPKNETLHVYVIPEAVPKALHDPGQDWLEPAQLSKAFKLFRWDGGRFVRSSTKQQVPRVLPKVQRVKLLGSVGSVHSLAESIVRVWQLPETEQRLLFFVVQPRVHPSQRITYAEVNAYSFQEGQTLKVGTFATDETSAAEVFGEALRAATP